MRNVAFLAVGLSLLIVQSNVFRLLDGAHLWTAVVLWIAAVIFDGSRTVRQMRPGSRQARTILTFRADLVLPATVFLGYVLLSRQADSHIGRPVPALVLPLILFMGVREYSLARGAAVAFVLGYATDVLGIAPVTGVRVTAS